MAKEEGKNGRLVQLALYVLSLAVGLGIGWGGKTATIEAHGKAIDELRTQQKADHDCLTELRKDIAYIREGIQEIKQSLPKTQSAIVSPGIETDGAR
jgi:hypothetical protein